jgi:hypothetical protein
MIVSVIEMLESRLEELKSGGEAMQERRKEVERTLRLIRCMG